MPVRKFLGHLNMADVRNSNDNTTGLPALSTWPAVYLLVTAIFALWVALLVALARVFS